MSALVAFLCRGCETGCLAERALLFVGLILIVLLLSAFDDIHSSGLVQTDAGRSPF